MDALPLKDIHLPEQIGWWPPAPGWWLLALGLPLLWLGLRYVYRRLTRKTALKRASLLLRQLQRSGANPQHTLTELSALLRRVAISIDDRQAVASLTGEQWLAYLDRYLTDAPFSQGVGRCLADAPYRSTLPADIELNAVLALAERWLKQQGKRR